MNRGESKPSGIDAAVKSPIEVNTSKFTTINSMQSKKNRLFLSLLTFSPDRKNKDSAYPCLRGDQCKGMKTFYKRRGARVCCEEGDKANVNAASNKCICRR